MTGPRLHGPQIVRPGREGVGSMSRTSFLRQTSRTRRARSWSVSAMGRWPWSRAPVRSRSCCSTLPRPFFPVERAFAPWILLDGGSLPRDHCPREALLTRPASNEGGSLRHDGPQQLRAHRTAESLAEIQWFPTQVGSNPTRAGEGLAPSRAGASPGLAPPLHPPCREPPLFMLG